MKTIHKFELKIADSQSVFADEGCKPVSVQCINDRVFLYAIVNPEHPKVSHTVKICGTGAPIPGGDYEYLGTVQQFDGDLVWHVFV